MRETFHTEAETQHIEQLVELYRSRYSLIRGFLMSFHAHLSERIGEGGRLADFVHSVKHRMKDPDHLRSKLFRKLDVAKEKHAIFDINSDNLFVKINDLGGYRILHLHTSQAGRIHSELLEVFETSQFDLFEEPCANIWDEEAKTFFERIGVRTVVNPRLYSSVHYVLKARSKNVVTFEVQVRTLADEIWGEVDHQINYPHPHPSVGCKEQIKVLARVASSCSRLVDSIMVAHDEWTSRTSAKAADGPGTSPESLGIADSDCSQR